MKTDMGYSEPQAEMYEQKRFATPQGQLFAELEQQQLYKAIDFADPDNSVLEVGCGTGRFLRKIPEDYDLVGVDISPHMTKECKNTIQRESDIVVGESGDLPFKSDSFEFVYTIRVLNQLKSAEYAIQTLHELQRVCAPGGHVLIEFCNRQSLTRSDSSDVLLNPDNIIQTIEESQSRVIYIDGILALSQTILEHTPKPFLHLFKSMDNVLSNIAPQHSTRVYILLTVN